MHPASPAQPPLLSPPRRGRTPHVLARLALAAAATLAGTSQAALLARDLDGNLATAEAVFDTSSQLTWLNQLSPGVFVNGSLASVWATSLTVGGVGGWRLPTVADTFVGTFSYGPTPVGRVPLDPALSELYHLYHVSLGNQPAKAWDPASSSYQLVPGGGWRHTTGFGQLPAGTRLFANTAGANASHVEWVFDLDDGSQSFYPIGTVNMASALAVHDGDVGQASTLVLDPGPPVISPAVPQNVALNRPVEVIDPDGELGNGGGWVGDSLTPAASLTDGVHLAEGNGWNSGTLFWTDANANGSFAARVQLDGLYTISRITLQADNNDAYLVRYQDAAGAWHDLTDVGAACCWGMVSRDVAVAPVVASAFEIVAHDGDRYYALSEFQAFGISAVPEPHSWALLALGCAALAGRQRRWRAATSP